MVGSADGVAEGSTEGEGVGVGEVVGSGAAVVPASVVASVGGAADDMAIAMYAQERWVNFGDGSALIKRKECGQR